LEWSFLVVLLLQRLSVGFAVGGGGFFPGGRLERHAWGKNLARPTTFDEVRTNREDGPHYAMRFRLWLIVPLFLLALGGWGCGSIAIPSLPNLQLPGSGSAHATSTPEDLAKNIQFLAGDTFEIRQTVLGFGAFLPDLLKSDDGVRLVTIKRFAPEHVAELAWQVTTSKESDASIKARNDYENNLKNHPVAIGADAPAPPSPEMVKETTSGTLLGINLRTPHSAYLPLYWPEGKYDIVGEKSAIWLSDDAFLELVNTRHTILNLGVFDDALNEAAKNVSGLKDAYGALRKQAEVDGKSKDLTELQADAEFIQWPISVNGETQNVSAIRAQDWFGEVIVLNNRQNPMILKVSLNPTTALAATLGGNSSLVQNLFGYEVKNIVLNRP
jgi:hypothetical protein